MTEIRLRPVELPDLRSFHAHRSDPEALSMAAFGAAPDAYVVFKLRWLHRLADPQAIARAIDVDQALAGHVIGFLHEGRREVAYWLDRARWGRGIAMAAVAQLITVLPERPIVARSACDNLASLRVLASNGFVERGRVLMPSPVRGSSIEEELLERDR